MFLREFSQLKLAIDRFWKESSFSDDKNDPLIKFIRFREVFYGVGFEHIS